jgi:hypothetical protein
MDQTEKPKDRKDDTMTTQIIKRATIAERCHHYREALRLAEDGLAKLAEAKKHAESVGPMVHVDMTGSYRPPSMEDVRASLLRGAWRWFLRDTGIRECMSQSRYEGIERRIKKGEMPPFTEQTVWNLAEEFMVNARQFADEAVQEVFEWLRPKASEKEYATNGLYEVPAKVIKMDMIDTSWGMARLGDYREQQLHALDNAMHLLDGRGTSKYPSNLVTALRDALKGNAMRGIVETEYFRCQWYKNGNMHIEFLRDDLRDRLNAIGGQDRSRLSETVAP